LRLLCPHMPMADFNPVLKAACARHLRHLPPSIALWQALGAHVRHVHTDYDSLLAEGLDRDAARYFVAGDMDEILAGWGCSRKISDEE
jgi:hypothetical protein